MRSTRTIRIINRNANEANELVLSYRIFLCTNYLFCLVAKMHSFAWRRGVYSYDFVATYPICVSLPMCNQHSHFVRLSLDLADWMIGGNAMTSIDATDTRHESLRKRIP